MLTIRERFVIFLSETVIITVKETRQTNVIKFIKEKEITIMTAKEWFKAKNTFRKVYNNMKEAHPDWSTAKLYMATKGQLNK